MQLAACWLPQHAASPRERSHMHARSRALTWRPQAHNVAAQAEAGGLVEGAPHLHALPKLGKRQAAKGNEGRQVGHAAKAAARLKPLHARRHATAEERVTEKESRKRQIEPA